MIGPILLYSLAIFALPIAADWHGFGFNSSVARAEYATEDARFVIWRNAVELIRERPWTGWGWLEMGYGYYITIFEPRFAGMVNHAHSFPLQVAVEFGLPIAVVCTGGLFWLIYLGQPWRVVLQKSPSQMNAALSRQFAWAVLMAIGIHSLLELPLWSAGFLFLTGLVIGFLQTDVSFLNQSSRRAVWAVRIASSTAIFLVVLAFTAWQQYSTVLPIYKVPFNNPLALSIAIEKAKASNPSLFDGYLDFAAIGLINVTPENAFDVRQRAEKLLHFSAEPVVIEPLLKSLWFLNNKDALHFQAERFCRAFPTAFHRWRQDPTNTFISVDINHLSRACSLKLP